MGYGILMAFFGIEGRGREESVGMVVCTKSNGGLSL